MRSAALARAASICARSGPPAFRPPCGPRSTPPREGICQATNWRRRTTIWGGFTPATPCRPKPSAAQGRRWPACTAKPSSITRRAAVRPLCNLENRLIWSSACPRRSSATSARPTWPPAGRARPWPPCFINGCSPSAGGTSVSTIWAASATSPRWIGAAAPAPPCWPSTPARPTC